MGIGRSIQTAVQVLPHRLAVKSRALGDGHNGQALILQLLDHNNLPEFEHPDLLVAGPL